MNKELQQAVSALLFSGRGAKLPTESQQKKAQELMETGMSAKEALSAALSE